MLQYSTGCVLVCNGQLLCNGQVMIETREGSFSILGKKILYLRSHLPNMYSTKLLLLEFQANGRSTHF